MQKRDVTLFEERSRRSTCFAENGIQYAVGYRIVQNAISALAQLICSADTLKGRAHPIVSRMTRALGRNVAHNDLCD